MYTYFMGCMKTFDSVIHRSDYAGPTYGKDSINHGYSLETHFDHFIDINLVKTFGAELGHAEHILNHHSLRLS